MTWGIADWVAIGSAVVAIVSLALNWLVVRRQIALQYESLKAQLEEDVLAWSQEAIDVLSEGVALARGRGAVAHGEDFRRAVHGVAQCLSSLVDRGRLFFPNEIRGDFGAGNETAFRGLRPPILDAMVFACCCLESITGDGSAADNDVANFLIRCRRLTVSEAQNSINPRRRSEILRRLAEGRKDDEQPPSAVVEELFAALRARLADSPVVKSWEDSSHAMRAARVTAPNPPPNSPG